MSKVLLCLIGYSLLLTLSTTKAALILNETFTNLDGWTIDIDGQTGVIGVVNGTSDLEVFSSGVGLSTHYLFSNVSYCGSDACYRAEVATAQALRTLIFPSCAVEYWMGVSIFIPPNWKWAPSPPGSPAEDVNYHYQLHGGDNEGASPILGIRLDEDQMTVNICGNTYYNSSYICEIYPLGIPALGQWMDFVVHSQLAFGKPTGYVSVWRNGQLMVNVKNLLTSYNQTNPPYLKLGSYNTNWKYGYLTGYPWSAAVFRAIRVGNNESSYHEVYTGTGTPCGYYCDLNPIDHTFNSNLLWVIIPVILVSIFSLVLYCGSDQYRQQQSAKELQESLLLPRSDSTHLRRSLMSKISLESSLHYSYGKYTTTDDDHSDSHDVSSFRSESQTRTIFWYVIAVLFTAVVFIFALTLYGRPGLLISYSSGFIPWKHVQQWSLFQLTMVVITATMMTIYFFPLYYLRHDFTQGKSFKNSKHFLRRIGVIIPCHKSANEIGEVLRRVLKYISPENIVVCDNGNFDWPPDNTFEKVKEAHGKIRYVYIKQGHKTRALWTGAHRLPSHVEYIIHLDDDTHFDEHHMVFDETPFLADDKVIAVAFLRSSYGTNLVTQFTDFWYKITDHFHATQAKIATRCFVPGPAGLWRRDKFLEIFGLHPSLPFGEDIFGGFTTLNKGYAIRVETRCMVKTFAPDILVPWFIGAGGRVQGYGASSLWKQRAHRWTVSALRITGKSLYSFFTYDTRAGIASNIAFRLYRFREYKLILVQLLYIPICLVVLAHGFYVEFILLKFMLFALPLARNVFINYVCWHGQPELQVSLRTVLLSPFFNFFLICCAIHGRWKCILWYLPNVAPGHGMLQRCRPKPLKTIVNNRYEPGDCVPPSPPAIAVEENDVVKSPMITPSLASNIDDDGDEEGEESKDEKRVQQGKQPQQLNPEDMNAEQVLRAFDDSFELFEKDGSSKVLAYSRASPWKSRALSHMSSSHIMMSNVVLTGGEVGYQDHAAALMAVA